LSLCRFCSPWCTIGAQSVHAEHKMGVKNPPLRRRIGQVSIYEHHGSWPPRTRSCRLRRCRAKGRSKSQRQANHSFSSILGDWGISRSSYCGSYRRRKCTNGDVRLAFSCFANGSAKVM